MKIFQADQLSRMFKFREEGIVRFFLFHGGHGSVSGTEDGIIGEGEDFFAVIFEGIGVGDHAAAHGAGEQGVADDSDGLRQAIDHEGGAAGGMAAGVQGADMKVSAGPLVALREGFGFGDGFELMDKDRGTTGFEAQSIEFENVIGVGMGNQYPF